MKSLAINTTLNDRISAFAKAGQLLSSFLQPDSNHESSNSWNQRIEESLQQAERKNSWFTRENLIHAITQWSQALLPENLEQWTNGYDLKKVNGKRVAIITAGNIPLVGFHDVLSVIISGHHAIIKNSSNDDVLIPLILDMASTYKEDLVSSYSFVKGQLPEYDAVIATGSNNTSRYFEYYFKGKPHIIRKNRNSIAVITGKETLEDMEALSEDVFRYFGLGCRSVSHLKVPRDYNFDLFFNGMYKQRNLIKFEKYTNNYDYNKAVYLMSEFDLLDNEFLLIKEENKSFSSPIASLGYSYYDNLKQVAEEISQKAESLQCVVINDVDREKLAPNFKDLAAPQFVNFGQTQCPTLNDYADGVDTISFLLTLS
ncbi:acyl-CoA reductase [Nonlabens tegetincola]|uniref:acyl-CoA reductase n=1 Tax=Nonlabens tegetincola TaxID=323273 RepID=UPI000A201A7F|nr:acyl-CoA reductase [Nonlabens tegetincola]ARN70949.1 acyl-CoA reductase [Nonlabens tegetincola]